MINKKIKKLVPALILLIAYGLFSLACASVPNKPKYRSNITKWCIPEQGKEAVTYIGDFLLKEGVECETPAIETFESYGTIHPAGYYLYAEDLVQKIHSENVVCKVYINESVCDGALGYPKLFETPDGKVFMKKTGIMRELDSTKYNKTMYTINTETRFEQNLIYTGAEGNILKITYREFYNDRARPAFSVDATYDLSKEKYIRYKDALIEVISYDNQKIKYKVLSGFKTEK